MEHLGLTIATPKERQFTRKRRRRTLALGLLLVAILAMGWWQISAAAESRGRTLVPAALLDVASFEPRDVLDASRGVSTAEYEARRQEYAGRELERPLGAPVGAAADEPLSSGEREDVLSPPLLPQ